MNLWEVRGVKLYRDPCCTWPQAGYLKDATVVEGQRRVGKDGKLCHSSHTERAAGKLCNCDVLCRTGSAQMSGWSMEEMVGQPIEYYYYHGTFSKCYYIH